jgi:hypothetical protein
VDPARPASDLVLLYMYESIHDEVSRKQISKTFSAVYSSSMLFQYPGNEDNYESMTTPKPQDTCVPDERLVDFATFLLFNSA